MSEQGGWTDSERIDLFLNDVIMLHMSGLITNHQLTNEIHLEFEQNVGLHLTTSQPNEELLMAYLIPFRRLFSKQQPQYVGTVKNIIARELDTTNQLRESLVKSSRIFNKQANQSLIKFNINNIAFGAEQITDFWINGYYFHSDSRKRKFLESLGVIGNSLVRQAFLDYLITATYHVFYVRNIIIAARSQGLISI